MIKTYFDELMKKNILRIIRIITSFSKLFKETMLKSKKDYLHLNLFRLITYVLDLI